MVSSVIFSSFTTSSKHAFGERSYDLYSEYSSMYVDSNMMWIFCSFLNVCWEKKSCVITVFVEFPLSLTNGICTQKLINDLGESLL